MERSTQKPLVYLKASTKRIEMPVQLAYASARGLIGSYTSGVWLLLNTIGCGVRTVHRLMLALRYPFTAAYALATDIPIKGATSVSSMFANRNTLVLMRAACE